MEPLQVMPIRIRITSILKKAIYSGEYRSGQELSLTEVAQRLGVSRTPVREAFQALAAEGLITLRMNRGAIVNQIDEGFIRDNFEMRILLEGEAAARAARNGAEVSQLLERARFLGDHLQEISPTEYEKLNQEIHLTIWSAARNLRLKNYLLELWNGPSTDRSAWETRAHYENSTREHIAILEAIRDGDPEGARAAMEGHIRRSMENILRYHAQPKGEAGPAPDGE